MSVEEIKNIIKENIINVKEINNSFSQKIYYIEANKKYIIKIYNNISKFENELSYLNYFEQKINVPSVYKHGNNKDDFYIVMEYIDGLNFKDEDILELDDKAYKEIGVLLGKMHSLKPVSENKWNEYMLYRIEKNYHILKSQGINVDKCYNYLKDKVGTYHFEEICMHSDFRMGNLVFGDEVYLLDFESVKTGDAVFDFVKMYRILNAHQFKLLLKGYKTTCILPNNFEERLRYYNLYDAFTTMGWCVEVGRYKSDFYKLNLHHLKKEIKSI